MDRLFVAVGVITYRRYNDQLFVEVGDITYLRHNDLLIVAVGDLLIDAIMTYSLLH